jgi:23S rRNA (guanosine2251-2'-O)-methyltransferase
MTKLIIVLDNIRSVFNVGSIFRTADASGNTEIYLCGITPTPENPKMLKTSLGAEKTVPWKYFPNTMDAVTELKKQQISIYSVELTKESKHFQTLSYDKEKIALIFGHEINGISQPILDLSDEYVYIPMKGTKESLNVAITASILIFEALRYNKG